MEVSITHFRKHVFDLVGRALKGENVSVTYMGHRLKLVPESKAQPATTASKFARFQAITPLPLIAEGVAPEDEHWKAEMMAEVEEDWASL